MFWDFVSISSEGNDILRMKIEMINYYMLDTLGMSSLNFTKKKYELRLCSFYMIGIWDSEKLSKIPESHVYDW